jgi:hypothetical protein
MSIISHASALGNSITLPTHAAGDTLVAFLMRNAAGTPATPTGWNQISTTSAGSSATKTAFLVATSSSEANLSGLSAVDAIIIVVFRSPGYPVGPTLVNSTASSLTVTFPAVVPWAPGTNQRVNFAQILEDDINIATAPSGYTTLESQVGTGFSVAAYEQTGTPDFSLETHTFTGTAANNRGVTVQLRDWGGPIGGGGGIYNPFTQQVIG